MYLKSSLVPMYSSCVQEPTAENGRLQPEGTDLNNEKDSPDGLPLGGAAAVTSATPAHWRSLLHCSPRDEPICPEKGTIQSGCVYIFVPRSNVDLLNKELEQITKTIIKCELYFR